MNHLPWALKVIWFILSLTGLLQSIVVLVWVGADMLTRWVRYTYLLGTVILEVMFCLGMIWQMDPTQMPRPFCIAQVLAFGLGSYILTGVSTSFALATSLAVLNPISHKAYTTTSVLTWHRRYVPLIIVFPVVACVVQTTLTFIYNDVQPGIVDDLHCDATDPLWMRLVGYAGPPQLVTLPFLCLSIHTAMRLSSIRQRVLSSNSPSYPSIGLNSQPFTTSNVNRRSAFGIGLSRANSVAGVEASTEVGDASGGRDRQNKAGKRRFSMWMSYPYPGYRANGERRSPIAQLRASRAAEMRVGVDSAGDGEGDEKAIDLTDLSRRTRSTSKKLAYVTRSDTATTTTEDPSRDPSHEEETVERSNNKATPRRLAHSQSDLSMSGALRAPSEAASSLMPTFAPNPSLTDADRQRGVWPPRPSSELRHGKDSTEGGHTDSTEGAVQGSARASIHRDSTPVGRGTPHTRSGSGTGAGSAERMSFGRDSQLSFVGMGAYALTTDEPDHRRESLGRPPSRATPSPSPLAQAIAVDEGQDDSVTAMTPPNLLQHPLSPSLGVNGEPYEPVSPHSARSPVLAGSYSLSRYPSQRYRAGAGRTGTVSPSTDGGELSPPSGWGGDGTGRGSDHDGTLFRAEPLGRLSESPPESEAGACDQDLTFGDAATASQRRHRHLSSVDGALAFGLPHPPPSSHQQHQRQQQTRPNDADDEYDFDDDEDGKGGVRYEYVDADALAMGRMRSPIMRTVESRDPMEREKMTFPTGVPLSLSMNWGSGLMPRSGQGATNSVGHPLAAQLRRALWRMVWFQIVFFGIQLLAALSPIIDVIRGHPSSFGTQHVALLLAAWGPFVIFSHTEAAKQGVKRLRLNRL